MKNQILKRINNYSMKMGNIIACAYLEYKVNYENFDKNTSHLANQIGSLINYKSQVPIIIYHKRNITFIEYMIATLKCGCYYIPLEHNIPLERVKYIYDDVQAQLIITDLKDKFNKNFNVVDFSNTTNYKSIKKPLKTNFSENDIIYVMYTSGTSGNPKGVKIKYSNLINLLDSFDEILYNRFKNSISVGVLSSFSFDASVKQIYCSLYYGHTLYIAENNVRYFGRKIHQFHVKNNLSVCDATPSLLNLMTTQKTRLISKIPFILIGGEILRWELLHKLIKFTSCVSTIFINVYGPTECCVDVAYKIIHINDLKKNIEGIVPVGKSIKNTTLTIRSFDNQIINECDIEGELVIAGKQVGAGYVNIKTESFYYEGNDLLYKTGDFAYINSDEEIVVVGRKDTQININGFRIELGEIQAVIERYLECTCLVFYEEHFGKNRIVAYICSDKYDDKIKNNLVPFLKNIIPDYMIPQNFIFIKKTPLTVNGKICRNELKLLFRNSLND